MKHTPGEWRIAFGNDGSFAIEADGGKVLCQRSPWPGNVAESRANAHVMVAGPDLLASCREFLPILERQLASINSEGAAEASSAFQFAKARVERMRAAIAKAEGRS